MGSNRNSIKSRKWKIYEIKIEKVKSENLIWKDKKLTIFIVEIRKSVLKVLFSDIMNKYQYSKKRKGHIFFQKDNVLSKIGNSVDNTS